jgi:cytochrome c biogenesis protein CcmG/thiol:disulfide interchange protein DsbE
MNRYFCLVALVLLMMAGCRDGASMKAVQAPGQKAPSIEGTGVNGESIKLSNYRGKVVLLDFWASWCGPCCNEIPHGRTLASRFSGKPFAILGISQDHRRDELAVFLQSNPVPWANIFDGNGKITSNWKVSSIPTFVLLDHNGDIRGRWVGGGQSNEIEKAVATLVAAAEQR